ncbi:porin family protein [Photobacterium swingsii]|uniref:outer membrane beta-barrel protein n=1 Tax=Photobacterium swingsii TaxID=680026 RepID=UPI003D0E8DFF
MILSRIGGSLALLACSLMPATASAYNQVYFQGGYSELSVDDKHDSGWITQVGYSYALSYSLAIETAIFFNASGTAPLTDEDTHKEYVDYRGAIVAMRGEMPISNLFLTYGKIGANYTSLQYSHWGNGQHGSDEFGSFRPYVAIGLKAPVSHNLMMSGEMQYLDMAKGFRANTFSLGLHFIF